LYANLVCIFKSIHIFYELPIYLQECIQFCLLHRFLGKLISQYISVYVQQGSRSKEIVFEGFDYERWKKTYLKSHSKQVEWQQFIYLSMYIYVYICISYNTGKSALPDIYARCPRARSARGRVHIYQATHECLCYN